MAPKDEAALVKQFREELVEEDLLHDGDSVGTDDATLLRFLRARQLNPKNAKIMWKNCHEWRQSAEGVGIDELYRQIDPFDYPERNHVFQFWPLFFHKTDKSGRPLNIHHFGRINTSELYKGVSVEKFWQAFLVNADSLTREVLPAAACAAGKPIGGTFVIVDLKGFGTGQFWQMKHLARGAFQVSQDYFPETMAQLAIVNAPSSFTAIWAVMRPWLAKETVAKVNVLGHNYQSALLELVDKENLPATLGGTCTCEDCSNVESSADGKGGVAEMGRCAFSSAGPWLLGRDKRRESWLKGERQSIALQPGEFEKFSGAEDGAIEPNTGEQESEEQMHSEQSTPKAEGKPAAVADTPASERSEQFFDAPPASAELLAAAEDSSEDASAGPSTPGIDGVQQQLGEIKISDAEHETRLAPERSAQPVEEKNPEQARNGDLHQDIRITA